MRTIEVKDSQWFIDAYNMPQKITVYVGETKAEHDARRKAELNKVMYDRQNGFSGFDEVDENGRPV